MLNKEDAYETQRGLSLEFLWAKVPNMISFANFLIESKGYIKIKQQIDFDSWTLLSSSIY